MKIILRMLLIATAIVFAGCQQEEVLIIPSGKIVKVGFLAPLSGSDQMIGSNALLGAKTALKMQPYLIAGDKVELVIEDSQNDPAIASAAMAKLCMDEEISGVLFFGRSDIAFRIASVADHYKTPVLALDASHPNITKGRIFISQLAVDDNFQATVAALFVRDELHIDRVAVFSYPENSHFAVLAKKFIEQFKFVGGTVIEHFPLTTNEVISRESLERLKGKETQLLYLVLDPKAFLQIARSVSEIGWNPKMMGSDGLLSAIILQYPDASDQVEGLMATDFYSAFEPPTPYGIKANEIFKNRFSKQGSTYAALACEGTSILLNALERCMDKSNKSCVNGMLRNTVDFEGLYGNITITTDGKSERPLFVNTFKDRNLKLLVKVY